MSLTVTLRKSTFQSPGIAIDPVCDWVMSDPPPEPDWRRFALIELRPGVTVADLRRGGTEGPDDEILFTVGDTPVRRLDYQGAFEIARLLYPNHYRGRFVTGRLSPTFIGWLATVPAVQQLIAGIVLCVPPGPLSEPTPPVEIAMAMPPDGDRAIERSEPVAIAVIDHGIPLAHPALTGRTSSGPVARIKSCWFQDGQPRPGLPRTTPYGAEIADGSGSRNLTPALAAHGADEHLVRRRLNVVVPLRQSLAAQARWAVKRASHGAAVLGLVAGEGKAGAARIDRPIIAVDLPEAAVMDPSGASLAGNIFDALVYIADRARELQRPDGTQMPVVVILSYGNNAGPHDGSAMIERAIADVVERWNAEPHHADAPFVVVISAGNAFQARGHAAWQRNDIADDTAAATSSVGWRIPPDDGSPNLMQLWLPQGFSGALAVTLTAPDGTACTLDTSDLVAGDLAEWRTADGSVIAQALWCPATTAGHSRSVLHCIVGPTVATPSTGRARALAGQWRVQLRSDDLAEGETIHAYIQSDDRLILTGRPCRQSVFVEARAMPFLPPRHPGDGTTDDGPVRRAGAMNAMATGSATLVVGAGQCSSETGATPLAARYSGGGLAASCGIDVLAVTDLSRQFPGRIVPGMTGNAHTVMFGTSLAAPVAARWVADNIGAFAGKNVRSAARLLLDPAGHPVDPRHGAGHIPAFYGGLDR